MPLKLHFKSKKAHFMHKLHNIAVPESIGEIFSVNSNQRYDLRSNQNHYVSKE